MSGSDGKSVNLYVVFNSNPDPVRLCTLHPGAVRRLVDSDYAYWKDGKLLASFDSSIRMLLSHSAEKHNLDPFKVLHWLTQTFSEAPQVNKGWAVGPLAQRDRREALSIPPEVLAELDAELAALGEMPEPDATTPDTTQHLVDSALLDINVPLPLDLSPLWGKVQAHYRTILDAQNAGSQVMWPGVDLPADPDQASHTKPPPSEQASKLSQGRIQHKPKDR